MGITTVFEQQWQEWACREADWFLRAVVVASCAIAGYEADREHVKRRPSTQLGIPRDELAVMKTLSWNQVEYLLIGGYAMRFYGSLRPAADVDLLIHNSPENAHRL